MKNGNTDVAKLLRFTTDATSAANTTNPGMMSYLDSTLEKDYTEWVF